MKIKLAQYTGTLQFSLQHLHEVAQSLKQAHATTKVTKTNQNIQIQTAQQMCMLHVSLSPWSALISPVPERKGIFLFYPTYILFSHGSQQSLYTDILKTKTKKRIVACIHSYVQLNAQCMAARLSSTKPRRHSLILPLFSNDLRWTVTHKGQPHACVRIEFTEQKKHKLGICNALYKCTCISGHEEAARVLRYSPDWQITP